MTIFDDIKARLDIVDIIEQSGVQLKQVGKTYTGFCPFHTNTRTPAFTVFPDTQSFYCFGCHAAGSVFDFVMQQQGLDLSDALKYLAVRAGIRLDESTAQSQHDQQRTRLLEITALAARYFNHILLQHSRGAPGRDYVQGRDINDATIETFQLGYALNEWHHLLTYLTEKKGYHPDDVVAAGLAVQRDDTAISHDRFRSRLIFPIRTMQGEVVGFGGRAIGDAYPKYLNTPQTLLFDKSRVLYGLDQAREAIRREDAVVIVEGYMDVLTAHQHGFRNVVAPLGTALNANHIAQIKKLTRTVYLALDADTAGQRATLRGIQMAQASVSEEDDLRPVTTVRGLLRWERDIRLRIVTMPAGSDPDDVIRRDPQQWCNLFAAAVPVVEFLINTSTIGRDMTQPIEQREVLESLVPVLAQLDGLQQRIYATRLQHKVGMRAELIMDMLKVASRQQSEERRQERGAPAPRVQQPAASIPPALSPEDGFMVVLLRYPTTSAAAQQAITEGLDTFPRVRELLAGGLEHLPEHIEHRMVLRAWIKAGSPPFSSGVWLASLDTSLRPVVERLAALALPEPTNMTYDQFAGDCARKLRLQQVRRWQHQLSQQFADAASRGDEGSDEMLSLISDLTRYGALL